VKGYQSNRVVQTFDAVGSRRDLLRAIAIGLPALVLASAATSAMQDAQSTESAAAGDASFDGHVDVGGRGLHIYCTGSGGPTVVPEAGYGDDWSP
jgi:hypothetical protein